MEKYEKLKKLKPEQFKRLTGVKPDTFEAMLRECEIADKIRKSRGGKPNKLSIPTQILLMLEYYREYRSMAHIAVDYGVSESTVSRTIRKIEDCTWLKSGEIFVTKQKSPIEDSGFGVGIFIVGCTEISIEGGPGKRKHHLKGPIWVVRISHLRIFSVPNG